MDVIVHALHCPTIESEVGTLPTCRLTLLDRNGCSFRSDVAASKGHFTNTDLIRGEQLWTNTASCVPMGGWAISWLELRQYLSAWCSFPFSRGLITGQVGGILVVSMSVIYNWVRSAQLTDVSSKIRRILVTVRNHDVVTLVPCVADSSKALVPSRWLRGLI